MVRPRAEPGNSIFLLFSRGVARAVGSAAPRVSVRHDWHSDATPLACVDDDEGAEAEEEVTYTGDALDSPAPADTFLASILGKGCFVRSTADPSIMSACPSFGCPENVLY